MNESSCTFEIIDQTVKSSENRFSVKELCKTTGVSRCRYNTWVKTAKEQDRKNFSLILEAYKVLGYKKGAESIYMDPPEVMKLKKLRRLMKKFGLTCPVRKANTCRHMDKALKTNNVAENLPQREFESYEPRMALLTDITYLPYNGTFAYLSTILDTFTKQVLAYVVSGSLEVDFVLETVKILARNHGVSLNQETIPHSDQGYHSTSCRGSLKSFTTGACASPCLEKGNC